MARENGDLDSGVDTSRAGGPVRPATQGVVVADDSQPPRRYGGGGLKRGFDVVAAALFLIAFAPLIALIAIVIKVDTPGPVFFRQKRLGRGGKPFLMLKFRKMPVDLPTQGPMLTRRSDPRLTRVGGWLERTKFDELPQLVNILTGEMSMIGPRPEVAKFVDLNDPLWGVVLSVRPGLFGISQIQGRNESSLYPDGCEDLEGFYTDHILPEKLARDADYVRRAGLLRDLELLFRGVMVAAFGTVTGSLIRAHGPGLLMLFSDVLASAFSFLFGFYVRLRTHLPMPTPGDFWKFLFLCVFSRSVVFVTMGIYRRKPDTLTYSDLVRIGKSVLYSSALLLFLSSLIVQGGLSRMVLLLDTLTLSAILIGKAYGVQQILRAFRERIQYWPLPRAAATVALGIGINTLAFYGLLRWLSATELSVEPIGRLAGLMLGFMVIRAYGICRYGLFRPTMGLKRSLLDVPRILRGTVLGSLFVYVSDWVFYSELVTIPILLVELVLSTTLIMILNRVYWNGISAEVRRGRSQAANRAEFAARVLLIGTGHETEFYLSYLERVPSLEVVGVVDGRSGIPRAHTINNVPVIGGVADLDAFLEAHHVDQVVYFPAAVAPAQRIKVEAAGERHQVPVHSFPDLLNLEWTRGHSTAPPPAEVAV